MVMCEVAQCLMADTSPQKRDNAKGQPEAELSLGWFVPSPPVTQPLGNMGPIPHHVLRYMSDEAYLGHSCGGN